jgi:hypothetical protein
MLFLERVTHSRKHPFDFRLVKHLDMAILIALQKVPSHRQLLYIVIVIIIIIIVICLTFSWISMDRGS